MEISRNELINILDSIGLEYELDSNNTGIVTEEKTFYSYSDLDLPIDYYKKSRNLSNHFCSNFDNFKMINRAIKGFERTRKGNRNK